MTLISGETKWLIFKNVLLWSIISDKSWTILGNYSKQWTKVHLTLMKNWIPQSFTESGRDLISWEAEKIKSTFSDVVFIGLILHRRCFHSRIASLGGAADPPCAGSCAGSGGSWTAGSCRAFGCGWWGWSFGWRLCRTPCTHVVSHLSGGTVCLGVPSRFHQHRPFSLHNFQFLFFNLKPLKLLPLFMYRFLLLSLSLGLYCYIPL